MSAQPLPQAPSQAQTPSPAAKWAQHSQHYQQLLLEMADIGADIVRIMHKTLRTQAGEPSIATILSDDFAPLSDMTAPLLNPHNKILQKAGNAFDVVTQSMRRSIMLAEKLAASPSSIPPTNPIPSGDSPSGDSPSADSPIGEGEADLAPANKAPANKDSDSQDDNERQDTRGREAEILQPERADRPDRPDSEFDLAARTFTDFLAEIVRTFRQQHAEWAEDTEDLEETEFPETDSPPSLAAPTTLPKNAETNTSPSAPRPSPPFPPEPFPRL